MFLDMIASDTTFFDLLVTAKSVFCSYNKILSHRKFMKGLILVQDSGDSKLYHQHHFDFLKGPHGVKAKRHIQRERYM